MCPVPLRERNKQKVTQRIIAVAVELFKTRGYHQTTIEDIAEQAEVSRRTLFNYFPSKEALLLPWAQEILEGHIQPKVLEYLATQPTTIAALRLLFTLTADMMMASPDVVRAFIRESLRLDDGAPSMRVGIGMQALFLQIVRYGQARGEVRTDLPTEHLAAYVGALQGPLLFSLLDTSHLAADLHDLGTLMQFVESGLRPDPRPHTPA
jgi:AcrR family transcriptional regulator